MGEGGGVFRILTATRRKIKMTSKPLCLVILTMRVIVQCVGLEHNNAWFAQKKICVKTQHTSIRRLVAEHLRGTYISTS